MMVKERDEMISDLKTSNARQTDRLVNGLNEDSCQIQQQTEQHYKQIINELSCRNEVTFTGSCLLLVQCRAGQL